jgi:hypothetical protein
MNLLRADERVALEAEWKAEFEKAQASDFMLSVSEDEILKGDYARAAHYRWADVPDKLLRKWTTAERRRRARARGAAQETAPGAVSSAEG